MCKRIWSNNQWWSSHLAEIGARKINSHIQVQISPSDTLFEMERNCCALLIYYSNNITERMLFSISFLPVYCNNLPITAHNSIKRFVNILKLEFVSNEIIHNNFSFHVLLYIIREFCSSFYSSD